MKEKKEKIDLLFERNSAEQLAGVDWDELNSAISSRLDRTQKSKTSAMGFQTVFKIAGGIAAAAVVFIAVMVWIKKPADMQWTGERHAVVKFIDIKGVASVEISRVGGKSLAMVDIGGSDKKVAKCDVKIIDLNGDLKEGSEQPAWIIISRPEPIFADNSVSRDMMSMIYLF